MACAWYVSDDKPECGLPGIAKVKVKGKVTTATVELCATHKAIHDETFMRLRQGKK